MLLLLPTRTRIIFATIVGGHTAAGLTSREVWPPLPPKDRAQALMAGMAAQVLACEKLNPGVDRKQAFDEYSDRCWTDLTSLEEKHGIHRARALVFMGECMEKLKPHWEGLKAIAGELEHRGTLYYREAELVFAGDQRRLELYRQSLLPAKPRSEWVARVAPGSDPGVWREHRPVHQLVGMFKSLLKRG